MNVERASPWPRSTATNFEKTRDGRPLSLNRQPRESLRPWVSNVYGIHVVSVSGRLRQCGIFAENAVLRVLLEGDWGADTADGPQSYGRQALLFGPNARRLPVSVSGNIATVGLALKPGAVHALRGPALASLNDRVLPYAQLGWDEAALMARFSPAHSVEQWMDALEDCMELLVGQLNPREPSEISAGFGQIAFDDPNIAVGACAEMLGVELRKLERLVKRDFGLSPKRVLRRARALDMAAHMCGVADQEEADELALRYFDQSHLNREFTELFGMTPMQFVRTPQPLMTISLEGRQARRLEALERIAEGARRPWQ